MATDSTKVSFAIDRGGTFTDVFAVTTDGTQRTHKLLSACPQYPDAPSEGIRCVLSSVLGREVPRPIPLDAIRQIRMGTTVATNALLERKGVRVALFVTKGFADVLDIGTQARPKLFDLNIQKPASLVEATFEVDERVQFIPPAAADGRPAGRATCRVIKPLDEAALEADLRRAYEMGIRSVAIALVHSYLFRDHEERAAAVAARVGFTSISVSSRLAPIVKYFPRAMTTVVNAYLAPVVAAYLKSFKEQFERCLEGVPLLFMQSDGGLVPADEFDAFRAVLSGPAGGVAACCALQQRGHEAAPLVGFDMGGTSTDVCRCVDGCIESVRENVVAGIVTQTPQVNVQTVAAGGGSILQWRDGMFTVGPDSAGATPGPKCYGVGGPLTVTDANVHLGRVRPEFMPTIFGPNGNSPIDVSAVAVAFDELAAQINSQHPSQPPMSSQAVAQCFVDAANEQMSRPIRMLTEGKGFVCKDHTLASFGGAGGQHAVEVARSLGIRKVLVHRHASIMSAVGIGAAAIVSEHILPWGNAATSDDEAAQCLLDALVAAATAATTAKDVKEEGSSDATAASVVMVEYHVAMRFDGTSTQITVTVPAEGPAQPPGGGAVVPWTGASLREALSTMFQRDHQRQFGFVLQGRRVIVDDVRIRRSVWNTSAHPFDLPSQDDSTATLSPDGTVLLYSTAARRSVEAAVYSMHSGSSGVVKGPCLVQCRDSVVVLDEASVATVRRDGTLVITLHPFPSTTDAATGEASNAKANDVDDDARVDPRDMTVFSHRFMSIAEQMGSALQQTAVSTNIKERLDFSCAIFDADAGLVANAPHIPVHLGAMGATVAIQKARFAGDWAEGEVVVCNHPAHGGSHLPDITVITPVHHADGSGLFCFVACRAHHSDVGGSTPGSMPPFSRSLLEEGAIIEGMKLVSREGGFEEAAVTELLMRPGLVPGCSGCRTLKDVISDLKAQVAANMKGVQLIQELAAASGPRTVLKYMRALQGAAEKAVRAWIRDTVRDRRARLPGPASAGVELAATDYMDDGTPIALRVTLDAEAAGGSAHFDFTGTGPQVLGSTNCPPQVVRSSILYSLRCLLGSATLPLNEGCMRPIRVTLPPNSILSPSSDAAIVAGNVLTSQRLTDVILYALEAVACSQGDMNNFTFGSTALSYYETICGGSGAGPTFHGTSAVHTHMTNTRITDVEWLEARFPVMLREFAIRRGSGGVGRFKGGDGVVRSFLFLAPVTACILSERRALAPRGLHGGGDGGRGLNLYLPQARRTSDSASSPAWSSSDVQCIREGLAVASNDTSCALNVGSKATVAVQPGDVFTILSPGGAAYGEAIAD